MDNNKSLKRCLATSVVALALATFAELSAAASGTTDLATSPLPTAPTASVLPNIMFTLDDSGSMGWDYLPDYVFSHSGSPEFYSAQYNGVYYNPQVTYAPGVNSTGSVMTMYADGTVFSTGSPWTAVPVDAYNKRQGTIDLTFVGRRTNNTPFYYTITPIEYCDSITLVTCTAATAPTGRYIFPAPVRFCKNSSLASAAAPVSGSSGGTPNCQGKYISGSYDNERFGNFARTDIVPGTATYSSRPNRTDCAAAPNCTYAEEMTNYANWYAFYRTRMQMMKTAAGRAFATVNDKYRVGFITINPGSPVSSDNYLAINKFDTAQKSAWYSKLYSQTAGNGTPLREALSRVGRHFAGKQDGINRGMSGDPVQYSCQQNFTILTTDGYWNAGSGNGVKIDGSTSVGNQDNVDSGYSKRADGVFDGNVSGSDNSLADVALYYYQTDLRPSSGSCNTGASGADVCNDNVPTSSKDKATHQHMVTFTLGLVDGLMYYQKDYETATTGDFAKIKSGASGCLFSSFSTCDWPMPVGDTETALDDLWHAAVAGRGQYFNARDPNALIDGLNGALDAMKTVEAAGAASSTSTPNISSSDRYIFSSTYRTAEWDGEVTAQLIDPGTGNVVPGVIWSAQAQLDAKVQDSSDSRTIYTFDSTATDKLKPFQWSNLTSAEQAYFSNKCSGTGSLTQCGGMNGSQKSDANKGDNLLNYLRGQKQYQNVLYRDRVHAFGDTVNAQPSVVSAPRYRFADAVSPAYSAFKSSNASRAPALYIAANDGMLHALDATNGNERWSYVPRMLLPNLYKLAEDPYSVSHQYYVDGSPETMDVYIGGAWKTILVGGLNAGGRGYYALDVTDPASPKALWEFCSDSTLCASSDSDLGYTFGNPVIAKRKYDGKWVVLVTSGYNNVSPGNGHGYLYVLDAATGTVLNKVDTGVGTTGTPSGLSKISAWADDPFVDATIPRAYGADLQGNVWQRTTGYGPARACDVPRQGGRVCRHRPLPWCQRLERHEPAIDLRVQGYADRSRRHPLEWKTGTANHHRG
jgi:type IV pilus assembly protein PilY1